MRTHLFAAPLVGAALILAGCGSSSDDKGPSKADYIKQADAICTKDNAALDKASQAALQALGTTNPSAAQQAKLATDVALPNLEGQLSELKALKPPKADKDTIDALYASLSSAIDKAKSDPTTLLSSSGGASPFADANQKASAYGLKVCGSDS